MLHANLAQAGSAKTLPYLVMFITSNAGGWAGDHLIASRRTSVAGARKCINTLGADRDLDVLRPLTLLHQVAIILSCLLPKH